MARIDALGAEAAVPSHGVDFTEAGGTGGVRTTETIASGPAPRSGDRCWKAIHTGVTTGGSVGFRNTYVPARPAGTCFFGFWHPTGSLGGTVIWSAQAPITAPGAVVLGVVEVSSTRFNLEVAFMSAAGVKGTVTTTVEGFAKETWHGICVAWNLNGTREVLVYVNGQLLLANQAIPAGFTSVTWESISWGVNCPPSLPVTADLTAVFDDLILDDTKTNIDPGRGLVNLKPSSDVQRQLALPLLGTHFDDVSDGSDGTAVVTSIGGAEFDIYGLTDAGIPATIPAANVTIPAVYLSIRAGSLTDTLIGSDQRVMLRLAGVDGTQAQPTVSIGPTTKRSLVVAATKPGGGNWTPADLDALQIKLGKQAGALAITYTYQETWVTAEVAIQANLADASAATVDSGGVTKVGVSATDPVVESATAVVSNIFAVSDTGFLSDDIAAKITTALADATNTTTDDSQVVVRTALLDNSTMTDDVVVGVVQALVDAGAVTDETQVKVILALTDDAALAETLWKQVYVVEGLTGGGAGDITIIQTAANITGTIDAPNIDGPLAAPNISGPVRLIRITGTIDAPNIDGPLAAPDIEGPLHGDC